MRMRCAALSEPQVGTPVALVAALVFVTADRAFFAETHLGELARGDAEIDEELHRSRRAPVAQREVVLGGAALVAMAFQQERCLGVVPQQRLDGRAVSTQHILRIGT